MSNRLSQLPVEVLILPDAPIPARLSQAPVEVLILSDAPIPARLSQLPIEVLIGATKAQVSQLVADALISAASPTLRASHVVVDVLWGTGLQASHLVVDVLVAEAGVSASEGARLSQIVIDALATADQPPGLRGSQVAVDVLVTDAALLYIRASHLIADVLITTPPEEEAIFNPDEAPVGLTWIEFIDSDGDLHVWSSIALPDPVSYFGGYKEHRVIEFGVIRRGLSNIDGQYEGIVWGWTLSG